MCSWMSKCAIPYISLLLIGEFGLLTDRGVRGRWFLSSVFISCDRSRADELTLGVAREVFLTRTATGPLARDDHAVVEDLAAPDTPGLGPLQSAREALDAYRAVAAERLGQLQLGRLVREPQVRVEPTARNLAADVDGLDHGR